ncbi:GNAT family N-acetyltransferase [Paucibacter sp. KCTC 42545]|uniref:GNAT family N-acetyltransferase n=1 Tax=Paucibacter sp. KCTC 42545 TaxID=1768242 RepID=UPI001E369D2C|nr:GNAT family N-acetyltransferase [Paucibacter sp. KCTC 42545]
MTEAVIVLTTERLRLRHMTVDDAAFMLRLLNEPSWLRFIGDRGVKTLADAQSYILNGPVEMVSRLGFGFYIVELKDQAGPMGPVAPVGICGLAQRPYLEDVDIGFAFLPEFWGQGYAFEAAAAVLALAHTRLGLRRVLATVRPGNQSSIKLLEKLGLRYEKTMPHPLGDSAEGARELMLYAYEAPRQPTP